MSSKKQKQDKKQPSKQQNNSQSKKQKKQIKQEKDKDKDKFITPLIDNLLKKLLTQKEGKQVKFTQQQILTICHAIRPHLLSQQMLIKIEAPLKIVGDIHGQFSDLIKIFKKNGFPPESKYLFLGDYVDRGKQSLQTIMLLFAYALKYPNFVFLLRGNHQSAEVNKLYGFYDECKRRYSIKIWKIFTDCFNCLPVAALIEDKILCMHGGISPDLVKIKKIQSLNRPTEIPPNGLLCDLLWSDPVQQIKGWHQNKQRGISKLFGSDILQKFLDANDLDLVCRAHQIVQEGYQFFGKKQLVTIFSAPNYCGMFQNNGAVMNVEQDLICSFQILKPQNKAKQSKQNGKKKMPKYIN